MSKIIIIAIIFFLFIINNSLFGQSNTLNKDSILSDVDVLFSSIAEIHPDMFAVLPKEDFHNDLEKIKDEIKKDLNIFDFYKFVTPLVAKLGDGHTRLDFPFN